MKPQILPILTVTALFLCCFAATGCSHNDAQAPQSAATSTPAPPPTDPAALQTWKQQQAAKVQNPYLRKQFMGGQ